MDERLTTLEIHYVHQQELLQQLNDALVRQQSQLDKMQAELERLKELVTAVVRTDPADDGSPPPHY